MQIPTIVTAGTQIACYERFTHSRLVLAVIIGVSSRAMHKPLLAYTLVVHHEGKPRHRRRLTKPVAVLGRDATCDLVLAAPGVSRHHAEIHLGEAGAELRDVGSKNGIKINGLPRARASLHDEDRIEIGPFIVVFHTGFVPLADAPPPATPPRGAIPETQEQIWTLPANADLRHLRALQQATMSLLQPDAPPATTELLRLLRDALRAHEAHVYSPSLALTDFFNGGGTRPVFKVRRYLAEQFQHLSEATPFSPLDLHRFQERAGDFHYLVAPVRAAGDADAAPLLVFIRPAEWLEFSPDERALLHLIVQLWARLVR